MKQKSTIFAVFMSAVIVAGSFCAAVATTVSATEVNIDEAIASMSADFRYVHAIDPAAVVIIGYDGINTDVTIPDAPEGVKISLDAEYDTVYNVDFSNFSKITRLTLSKDVTMVSAMFMLACSNLKEFNVSPDNSFYYSKDGVLYLADGTLECYPSASSRITFTVPDDTQGLTQNAFVGCSNLQSLTFPTSLKTAHCGVMDCPNLKEITFLGMDTEILEGFGNRCSSELTIYGYKNSTAETFAAAHGFLFVDLNVKTSPEPEPEFEPELQPSQVMQPESLTETYHLPTVQISQPETKIQSDPEVTPEAELDKTSESNEEKRKTESKPESRTEAPPPAQTSQPETSVQSDPEESSKVEASMAPESKTEEKSEESSKTVNKAESDVSKNDEVSKDPKNTGSGAKGGSITTGALETTDSSPSDNNGIIFWVCCAAGVLIVSAITAIFIVRKRKIK